MGGQAGTGADESAGAAAPQVNHAVDAVRIGPDRVAMIVYLGV